MELDIVVSSVDKTPVVSELDSDFVQYVHTDATAEHIAKCTAKLRVLLEQQVDLSTAIGQLLDDIAAGRKYMKVYRQMKMYNDADTNPVLYAQKK